MRIYGSNMICIEYVFHLSAKREVGRLERRLLLSDKEWREFTLANIEPLNDLTKFKSMIFLKDRGAQ